MRLCLIIVGLLPPFSLTLAVKNKNGGMQLENMNGDYKISNPNPHAGAQFDSHYSKFSDVEYFDVYSPPIRSRYGDVYWRMMSPVHLDQQLVDRFNGKTMAVVGYEVDQVVVSEGQPDKSVPITHAYNHHYIGYLSTSTSELVRSNVEEGTPAMDSGTNHGHHAFYHTVMREDFDDPTPDSEVPTSQFISEGNGGEFRKSYHGYPKGFAQLVESPTTFHIQPMQIDTKNRHYNGTDFKPDLLPAASLAPPDAPYSGLLECPCTDRIEKKVEQTYATKTFGSCIKTVVNASQCFEAAEQVVNAGVGKHGHIDRNATVSSTSLPKHCSMVVYKNGTTVAFFNEGDSKAECGGGQEFEGSYTAEAALTTSNVNLDSRVSGGLATLTLTGPPDKWFALSLGSPHFDMADKPYTIVVDGKGNVQERKLGDHDPGQVLAASLRVLSNSVVDGQRRVVVSRPFKGHTVDHFTFDPSTSTIPVLAASGNGPNFAYHGAKQRTGGRLQLSGVDSPTCLCDTGRKGSIEGIPFNKHCLDEPFGDLVQQKNPTCWIETYQGGQECCHHGTVLLDADQKQPEETQTYHLKFRFYFQPYTPATGSAPASHRNLLRMYYQTEAWSSEYDIPQCDKGTPSSMCTHEITAHFTVEKMAQRCDIRKNPTCWGENYDKENQGINLIYAAGHCHAPACISMELYNADTGKLLCAHYPDYGKTNQVFDELGYISIPPCIWGSEEEGLMSPVFLPFNANLTSIKRNNNTWGHYGEMASWQMRGVLAKLPVEV